MYFLYIVGDNLEDVLGHKRLLWYLVCGLLASFTSFIVSPLSEIPCGASGAIAGLFGMYLMWFALMQALLYVCNLSKETFSCMVFCYLVRFNIFGAVTGPGWH
ncbi:rhomboid family intramembrane serine protease (plasmid) [Pseudoalteromonas espejiana]